MKRYVVFFLSLILLLSCCGCNPGGLTLDDGSILYRYSNINEGQLEFKGEDGTVLLNGKDVAWVYSKYSEESKYHLILEFTVDGTNKLAEVTKENIGKEISLFADGEKVISTVIEEELTEGQLIIRKVSSYRKLMFLNKKITGMG